METNEKSEKIYDSAKLINPFVDEINSLFENRFILKRMIYTNFKIFHLPCEYSFQTL